MRRKLRDSPCTGSFLVAQGSFGSLTNLAVKASDMGDINPLGQKYLKYERSKSMEMIYQ